MNASVTQITIAPMIKLPVQVVETYWQTLYMHGYLDYRLCDVDRPTWEDVMGMIRTMGNTMYAIVNQDAIIQGEFMLENFTGSAAQVHFSALPGLPLHESVSSAKTACNYVKTWNIKTLFGLIPVTNRGIRIFSRRVGFRRLGVLANGIRDRGRIVDGHIMVKEL